MSYEDDIIWLADYAYTGKCLFAQRRLAALGLVLRTRDYNLAPLALVAALSKIDKDYVIFAKNVKNCWQILQTIPGSLITN